MKTLTTKNNVDYAKLAEEWFTLKYPTITKDELIMACQTCQSYKLSPVKNEIYFIKYGSKPPQLVVNYQVILAKAMQDERIFRWTIEYWQDGHKLEHPHLTPNMKGVVVSIKIYDKHGTLITDTDWDVDDNYASNSGSFRNTNFNSWVQKCALTNAFRRTAPNYVQGLYIEDEFVARPGGDMNVTAGAVQAQPLIKASISPLYKNVIISLKNQGIDKVAQCKLIEDYQTYANKTHDDLVSGNFDVSDMMAFMDEHKPNPTND